MLYRYLLIFLTALMGAQTALSQQSSFRISNNQSIEVDHLRFSNLRSYFKSDYFKNSGKRCGSELKRLARIRSGKSIDTSALRSPGDCTTTLTRIMSEYSPTDVTYIIPVWFHVIYNSAGTGNISNAAINTQMQVLNEDYAAQAGTMGAQGTNTRIQFVLRGITRTQNNTWFNDGAGFQAALGKDPNRFLNVYTNTAGGNLGYASFPQTGAGATDDGVVMLYNTIGGRNNGNGVYDQGRTLVHEVGHYLGLEHTFNNGGSCQNTYSTGDLIVDTNAEATPHYGCAARTTCGSPDPIDNYMDYSDDICMVKFTPEQANRQVCSLVNYRPNLATVRMVTQPPTTPPSPTNPNSGNTIIIPLLQLLLLDE